MDDREYFATRERDERALANAASSAKVRDVHLLLAEKYAALAANQSHLRKSETAIPGRIRDPG